MWIEHGEKSEGVMSVEFMRTQAGMSGYFDKVVASKKSVLVVAEDEGKIVGCCTGALDKLEKWYSEKEAWYIDDLVVDPAYRGKGIGTALAKVVIEEGKKRGLKVFKSRIHLWNEASKRIAEKLGLFPLYSEYFMVEE
jgi:ribosomal protein S18 acetylase RimI-like enzyme